jgi:prevent-host-death family protein
MKVIGLRELRQHASELVRDVEAGEELTITVSGRATARLVPAATRTWRKGSDLAGLFRGQDDPDWAVDRDLIDQQMRDPWATA